MKTAARLFAIGAVLCAYPALAHADDAMPLVIGTPKVGTVFTHQATIAVSANGMDITITQVGKVTLKEKKPDGNFSVEAQGISNHISINGQEQDQPPSPAVTIVFTKLNHVVSVKLGDQGGFMAPEVAQILAFGEAAVLPDKPVKTNDTWTVEYDNPAVKDKKVTIKATYLGTEKVGEKSTVKIKQTIEAIADTDGSKLAGETTFWIDPSDGNVLKMEQTETGIPTQFGPLSWKVTSKNVPNLPAAPDAGGTTVPTK